MTTSQNLFSSYEAQTTLLLAPTPIVTVAEVKVLPELSWAAGHGEGAIVAIQGQAGCCLLVGNTGTCRNEDSDRACRTGAEL